MRQLAIVTGTSAGIGRALATHLLARGWSVIGVSRRPAALDGAGYRHLSFDLAHTAALESALAPRLAAELAAGDWERLGLVNNAAAMGHLRAIERWDPETLLRVYAVNVVAAVWLMGWIGRAAPERPVRIVNLSSGAAARPIPGLADYGSSKAALRLAGGTFAAEHEGRDLAVLSYEPGVVETAMQETARAQPRSEFPSLDLFLGFARSGQNAPPEAVVPLIVGFLEDPRARGFSERRYGT